MRLSPKRDYGRFGTVHLVRFVIDNVIESYCGSTRQDIYGYSTEKDRVTCSACLHQLEQWQSSILRAEKEVHSGE